MARPSLLQAIFQQPSQHVSREPAYAQPAAWRASFPSDTKKERGRRPVSLDVDVEQSPSPSPSPTPPLLSPASTPSSTPSFTDDTSDSSADGEFSTPPDSPRPHNSPRLKADPQTLDDSLLMSTIRPSASTEPPLFTPDDSPQSLISSSTTTSTARPHGVRQTPLSGVPDWAKDVRWLVGHQPAKRPDCLGHVRAATAPARPDDRRTDQPAYPRSGTRRSARRARAMTEGKRSGYRMSALVEVSEGEEAADTVEGLSRKRSTSQQRTRRTHSVRSSSSASSSRTVLAPVAAEPSFPLPRPGFPKPSERPTSTLDSAKNGLAQSTMSSISIIRGGSSRYRRISLSLNNSRSSLAMSSPNPSLSSLGSRSMLGLGMGPGSVPLAVRLAEIDGALGLTSHSPPPRKVGSSQVLVQVHAVALDSLDALIVSQRLAKGGFGFVPGRSFVGRAIECGFEVGNVSRGEWVIGLTDIRKSGALSEFIVVDKGRVCTIPRPTDKLTTTQCALLPLSAVPAHRAVRTIPNSKTGSGGERRPMRVLVLQAHDGAGLLAVQTMRGLGMRVTAQVPLGAENTNFGLGPSLGLKERGRTRAGKGRAVEVVQDRLEKVEVVVGDDPIEVIGQLEAGVYDAVIDTVGGRGVWDACRRIMCGEAHFTTLVGDSSDTVPSMNAHVRSSFRSLARAFAKQGKAIGYQWVSPAADLDHEGEDIRHSLTAVAEAAVLAAYGAPNRGSTYGEDGIKTTGMLPRVTCSFPMERAPNAFAVDEDGRGPLVRGGTVVVRVL